MGHRLSRIVTRTGDAGDTGLASGDRVAKTDARIQALGELDELNSHIGVVLTHRIAATVRRPLTRVQHELFDLGGELSLPGTAVITEAQVVALEADGETLNRGLPPLKEFVLPGGRPAAAHCHLARSVCRRAERCLWCLDAETNVNAQSLRYLNRLSDVLFIAARRLARSAGGREVTWSRSR